MSKKDIIKAFKTLHRITRNTFEGDKRALIEAKQRINEEFRKTIPAEEIGEKLKVAEDVGKILKHQVVQLSKKPEADKYGKKFPVYSEIPRNYTIFFSRNETQKRNNYAGKHLVQG